MRAEPLSVVKYVVWSAEIPCSVEGNTGRDEVETPERIRGIDCRLPMGDLPPRPTVCHCDVTPDRLHDTPLEELLAPDLGVVGWPDRRHSTVRRRVHRMARHPPDHP